MKRKHGLLLKPAGYEANFSIHSNANLPSNRQILSNDILTKFDNTYFRLKYINLYFKRPLSLWIWF